MIGMDSLAISTSGLTAERLRMDVIANNIANAQTTRTPEGGPYRRQMVVLTPGNGSGDFSSWLAAALQQPGLQWDEGVSAQGFGVSVAGIVKDPSPFKMVYDPANPDAVNGYVQMPNVDLATEMADLVAAQRVYEANVTAFDAAKQMDLTALNLAK
ncbi:flagellar basal-body rod protein FlgC [Alicyclobacillus cellulosilyticus]|uniref:Flagellar basal-body rod protein FlgC n=1 Tax=Alicyclobacillus cellulosilyticus TaxID=1003997 RepID=A0A917NF39_9BACL|nr:flagellar basal body rod protein FlgC [Alicyclobacillus cellulosilyticus]GGI94814.1 flagellar basal-body rod protein FlgC [Alicyclobacillus cellulosilyticus]